MSRHGLAVVVLVSVLVGAGAWTTHAADRYDARLRFRSIHTPHFTIHYHQGIEPQARRLAGLVEQTRSRLEAKLHVTAPRHTHVVLVDQSDAPNGWSTPFPYNLIELTLMPPSPSALLGNADDWLELVFTHEYTHSIHLDQVRGPMRGFRSVLGRHPLSFANVFLPTWQVEGMATYAESLGGQGRVYAPDVRGVLGAQFTARQAPHLDQLGGGLAAWPGGNAAYYYGGAFTTYLANRFGDASIGRLTEATAARLPYFGLGAYQDVFGTDVSTLWRDFVAAQEQSLHAANASTPTGLTKLTTGGYLASSPRFGRAATSSSAVYYGRADAHGFPSLRVVAATGGEDRRVADRYLGQGLTFWNAWLVYDQLEYHGPVALFSDVYAREITSGRTIRLTTGRRASEPDISFDGRQLATSRVQNGSRVIDVHTVTAVSGAPAIGTTPTFTLERAGCSLLSPRWSPDGAALAMVEHCLGRRPAVVVYNITPASWTTVAPAPYHRTVSPAWTPDGMWLVFTSDRHDGVFRLYAARRNALTDAPVEVLRMPRGAMAPDVSPDGNTLAFLSPTPAGLQVFSAPLPDLAALSPANVSTVQNDADSPSRYAPEPAATPVPGDAPYSPWSTLLPRAWQPFVAIDGAAVDVGGIVAGSDALGRHTYALTGTWPVSRPTITAGLPSATRPNWWASYSYDRWRPTWFVSVSDVTDTTGLTFASTGEDATAQSRTRDAFAGFYVRTRRTTRSQLFLAGIVGSDERIALADRDITRARHGLRAGWVISTAREPGYAISPERGVRLAATAERIDSAFGADGDATTYTADGRIYLPLGPRHTVLALRAAAGHSDGDAAVTRRFAQGGVAASPAGLSFARGALGLVRGLSSDAIRGTVTAGANADLRVPVYVMERGIATWPLFVNQVHTAVFADYAAVGEQAGRWDRQVWSAGVELSAQVTIGYGLTLSVTAGMARTHDGGRIDRPWRTGAFVRTGYAF